MPAKSSYTRSRAARRGLRVRLTCWLGRPLNTGIGVRAEPYDTTDGEVGSALIGALHHRTSTGRKRDRQSERTRERVP